MKFTIGQIKEFAKEAAKEDVATGDSWVDDIYERVVPGIIGHTTPYYLLWYIIASELKPNLVVELGAWRAFGAAHFAVGNPNGRVITIDIHKDAAQAACHAAAKEAAARYQNLDFLHGWTWDSWVVDAVKKAGPIDVLVIDAWHEYEYVKREWALYEPLLADEALVILDDVFDAVGTTIDMVKFWEELPLTNTNSFLTSELHNGIPMGFLRYLRKSVADAPVEKAPAKKAPAKKTTSTRSSSRARKKKTT